MTKIDSTSRCRTPRLATCLGLALATFLTGCGGPPQGAVKGKVTCMGAAVTGGTLIFGPVGTAGHVGQPAAAAVKADGSYVLGTSSAADGALIGRHRVTYTPPPQKLTAEQRSDPNYIAPPPLFIGMVPATAEVEVKAGQNTINIELTPAP